jgi:hypothetical protein
MIVYFGLLYVLEIKCGDYIKCVFEVIYLANGIFEVAYFNEVFNPGRFYFFEDI